MWLLLNGTREEIYNKKNKIESDIGSIGWDVNNSSILMIHEWDVQFEIMIEYEPITIRTAWTIAEFYLFLFF